MIIIFAFPWKGIKINKKYFQLRVMVIAFVLLLSSKKQLSAMEIISHTLSEKVKCDEQIPITCYKILYKRQSNRENLSTREVTLDDLSYFVKTDAEIIENQNYTSPRGFTPYFPYLESTLSNGLGNKDTLNKAYFTKPKKWAQCIVGLLCQAKSEEDLSTIVKYTREYLSYGPLSTDNILKIRREFEESQLDKSYMSDTLETPIEELCTKYPLFFGKIKWPHQTTYQAFMGYLFFPVQFEYGYEGSLGLCLRSNLQDLLSHAAGFENVLAQYHMVDVIEQYEPDVIDNTSDSDESSYRNKRDIFIQYFGKKRYDLITSYASNDPIDDMPCYFAGLLCIELDNRSRSKEYFKKGSDQDTWCLFRHIRYMKEGTDKEKKLSQLKEMNEGMFYFITGSRCKSKEKKITYFKEAGQKGFANGYHFAAKVSEEQDDRVDQASHYYWLAASNHILDDYEKIVTIRRPKYTMVRIINHGDKKIKVESTLENHRIPLRKEKVEANEEAKIAYKLMGDWGNEKGYYLLGNILWKEGKYKEANNYYKKSGCFYGYRKRIIHTRTIKEEEKLKENQRKLIAERFEKLLENSGIS